MWLWRWRWRLVRRRVWRLPIFMPCDRMWWAVGEEGGEVGNGKTSPTHSLYPQHVTRRQCRKYSWCLWPMQNHLLRKYDFRTYFSNMTLSVQFSKIPRVWISENFATDSYIEDNEKQTCIYVPADAAVIVFVIFRSARTSCITFGWSRLSVPCALKIWITYIQAYMPYESWEDSSNQPYGPMGSPGCPLDPLGPPAPPPPHRPPQTSKQVPWPHCTLKITSTALQINLTPSPPSPLLSLL